MKGFASNAGTLGSALTRTVTLPFLAIGGAAVKSAIDFNSALTRVAALTPILDQTGQSFQGLQDQILALADDPRIVAGPTDLANALYFAGSAGLKAADAMEVVRLSAEGQSVGMGDAADISKVLIFAMNNYAREGLTAADAMDTLTAAIREGTAEPEDLAVALGRLLPVAQQAGVSFQEVTAGVAALTNLGVPARVATTSLRALFSQLLAPTIAATKQLNSLGITADQLRFKLQQGPIEAFKLLTDATKGNFDQIRTLIPQIRGLTAFYGLSGDSAERYRQIIDAVTNSQGTLERVIAQFQETPAFKFQKSLQQLQVAAIDLGNTLLPVFNQIIGVITDMASVFQALPGPIKDFLAVILTVGAAVGPLLKLYSVIAAFGTTGVASIKALSAGFVTAGFAAATAAGGFLSLIHGSSDLSSILSTLIGTVVAAQLAIKALQLAANAGLFGVNSISLAIAGLGGPATVGIAVGIAAIATAVGLLAGRSAAAAKRVQQFNDALKDGTTTGKSFADTLQSIQDVNLRNLLNNLASAAGVLTNLPTQQALPQLQIPQNLSDQLNSLNQLLVDNGASGTAFAGVINRVASALNGAQPDFDHMVAAFYAAGGASPEFTDALHEAAGVVQGEFGSSTSFAATSVEQLATALQGARGALADYDNAQLAQIAGTVANESAIDDLASKYGVSSDFISQKLGELGVNAFGMSDQTEQAFAQAAFGVDKNGNLIEAKSAEMSEAVTEAMSDLKEAITGAVNPFEKLAKDGSKSFDKYMGFLEDANRAQAGLLEDINNLSTRGVPVDLIEQLLGAGGVGAISKFADATDKELAKYVRAWEVNLELGDVQILKEGKLMQGKAKSNIQGFARATLTSGKLLPGVAREIVSKLTTAFEQGNLKPAAFDLMTQFIQGLDGQKNITKKEGSQLAQAFATQLLDKHNYSRDGELILNRVALGISKATHLPIEKVRAAMSGMITAMKNSQNAAEEQGRRVAQGVARGVKEQEASIFHAGQSLMAALARGIISNQAAAAHAAGNAAVLVKNILDQNLHGSPQYASYHMGEKFARQFREGFVHAGGLKIEELDKRSLRLPHNRTLGRTSVSLLSGDRHHHRGKDAKVKVSRRRIAQELDTEDTYVGF